MGKFKISLEFKLNIEGQQEDVPAIMSSLQKQIGSALSPSAQIVSGGRVIDAQPSDTLALPKKEPPKRARRRSPGRIEKTDGGEGEKTTAYTWLHDSNTWGFPPQTWNNRERSIWLLHVATACANVKEMTPAEIASTFNSQFKEAGQIRHSNISRDLNSAKTASPALISFDLNTNKVFLTTAGKAAAEQLCLQAKGQTSDVPS